MSLDLPERVPYSDLPETASQHPPYEGLQLRQSEKIPWMWNREGHEEKEVVHGRSHVGDGAVKRRKCGLAPGLFWSLVAGTTILVIIAAVVGGVVGRKSQDRRENADNTSLQGALQSTGPSATSSTASPTSSSFPALETTILHTADGRTLYRDCPSSDDMVYTYGGVSNPMLFRKFCGRSCFNTQGTTAMINQDTDSLDDCIDLCASYNLLLNQTQIISNDTSAGKSVCSAVCWRWSPRNPDWPGHCFGYASVNVSGHFNVSEERQCDSAAWMNQYF